MIQDGGPAFPCGLQSGHLQPLHAGMSLRDWFAGKELQRLEYAQLMVNDAQSSFDRVAKHCYRMADAMLEARKA